MAADRPVLTAERVIRLFSMNSGLFGGQRAYVRAVDGVDFSLYSGETLGLVGESGCGKSTLARMAVALLPPTSGHIRFEGEDVGTMRGAILKRFRRSVQIVFQDPFASLDPRRSILQLLTEPFDIHGMVPRKDRRGRAEELLSSVGLDRSALDRRPRHFSGGQRQRISIARALALKPRVLVLDEPVSALDVSIQAQLLNLLKDLQDDLGHSYLLISHDLAVVRVVADRVAVMYLGKIIETGLTADVFSRPAHPYTVALLSAVPKQRQGGASKERIILKGDIPSPARPPSGCRFRTRCWKATELCALEEPPLERKPNGTVAACHYPEL